jgi:hypothetical protein
MSRKVRAVIFWLLLGLGVGLGAPYDPKQTEDIVRIMNETKVEVVLEKGDGPPEGYEVVPVTAQVTSDDARATARRMNWRMRLKRFLKLS